MASISRAGRSTSVNNSHKSRIANDTGFFLRLQVGILAGDILDAGTRLVGVQVVVAQNHGAGVALVELFKKSAQGSLLRLGARVGGLTADITSFLRLVLDQIIIIIAAATVVVAAVVVAAALSAAALSAAACVTAGL